MGQIVHELLKYIKKARAGVFLFVCEYNTKNAFLDKKFKF